MTHAADCAYKNNYPLATLQAKPYESFVMDIMMVGSDVGVGTIVMKRTRRQKEQHFQHSFLHPGILFFLFSILCSSLLHSVLF